MSEKFYNLIKECLTKGILISGVDLVSIVYDEASDKKEQVLGFMLNGFSKSGTATLYEIPDGNIELITRYNQIDKINDFEDIARVAFDWYVNYKDRETFRLPDENWADIFCGYGWLHKETVINTVYKLNN